ncbi:MAG: hydroxyisourate hydrolase [Egicoccus sp.]
MSLSTHVLDTSVGRPATGVQVFLDQRTEDGGWSHVVAAQTDADGRVGRLVPAGALAAGVYRLTFAVADWAAEVGTATFFPEVSIVFEVTAPEEHHHVPLLLSPFGYSTYRGS